MSPHKEPVREVPRLDFSTYTNGTEEEQATFCQDIRHSLNTVGFVKLINHGISNDTIDKAFHWVSF